MKKTDLLFQMLEHPEQYSEAQWRDILADEECRELYTLMAKTKSASQSSSLTDEEIEAEWRRLSMPRWRTAMPLWRKIAASAAIAVTLFGLTYAAVRTGFFGLHQQETTQNEAEKTEIIEQRQTDEAVEAVEAPAGIETAVAEPKLYDDVPLEQMLTDLSAYYHVEVEYRSDDVRSLRLYYQWEPDYPLDKVVEMLSHFETFNIRHEGNKLIVESSQQSK